MKLKGQLSKCLWPSIIFHLFVLIFKECANQQCGEQLGSVKKDVNGILMGTNDLYLDPRVCFQLFLHVNSFLSFPCSFLVFFFFLLIPVLGRYLFFFFFWIPWSSLLSSSSCQACYETGYIILVFWRVVTRLAYRIRKSLVDSLIWSSSGFGWGIEEAWSFKEFQCT